MSDVPSDHATGSSMANRDGSPINRTEAALLGRGIDSTKAASLRNCGWTLGKLKQANDNELARLGLAPVDVEAIRSGGRPEIPFDDLVRVLIANRFTCCVCHDPNKPIVVHHIHEWATSHDHSPHNLAVLCLDHHDKAHTKSSLSQNLDGNKLQRLKAAWEEAVRRLDTAAILEASRIQSDAWLYVNHIRLFELAKSLNVQFQSIDCYHSAVRSRLVDANGGLRPRNSSLDYMYNQGDGMTLYCYVRDVMHAVLERLTVLNISDQLDRGLLRAIVKPGDFAIVQGAYTFSTDKRRSGRNQIVTGARSANHVEISFTFDRWEATSTSAWSLWLRGHQNVASLLRLVNVEHTDDRLRLSGTVLGISQAFTGLKTREYASFPYRQGVIQGDDTNEKEWTL